MHDLFNELNAVVRLQPHPAVTSFYAQHPVSLPSTSTAGTDSEQGPISNERALALTETNVSTTFGTHTLPCLFFSFLRLSPIGQNIPNCSDFLWPQTRLRSRNVSVFTDINLFWLPFLFIVLEMMRRCYFVFLPYLAGLIGLHTSVSKLRPIFYFIFVCLCSNTSRKLEWKPALLSTHRLALTTNSSYYFLIGTFDTVVIYRKYV